MTCRHPGIDVASFSRSIAWCSKCGAIFMVRNGLFEEYRPWSAPCDSLNNEMFQRISRLHFTHKKDMEHRANITKYWQDRATWLASDLTEVRAILSAERAVFERTR